MSGSLAQGRLVGLQVGMPQRRAVPAGFPNDNRGGTWYSGIFKEAVSRRVRVTTEVLEGDGAADPRFHGGPDNVVLAYDAGHYPMWRAELGRELAFGSFGENFTVEGFSDATVCVGDVWRVGLGGGEDGCLLEVTQARQPCWKLARRLESTQIVKRVMELGWGGWYLRVLEEGFVEVGMGIALVERRHAEWPVQRAVWTMYRRNVEEEKAQELAALPELSARWKRELLGF